MNRLLVILVCLLGLSACKKEQAAVNSPAAVAAQAVVDRQKIREFINANNLQNVAVKVGYPKTDTIDVWYIIVDSGSVVTPITNSTKITVGFKARQMGDTTVFASTNTFHPTYTLGSVIRGWQSGIQKSGIKKGGTLRLLMASRYAYGPYAQPEYNLPPNALLDFNINFFDITN